MLEELSKWLNQEIIEPGLIRVYKPYGIHSTAITDLYKYGSNQKVGHGGTLDPFAEGSLILGIGFGTKKLTKVLSSEKTYYVSFLLGASSISGDLEQVLEISGIPNSIVQTKLVEILEELKIEHIQKVPAFSAVRHAGLRSYDLARESELPIQEKTIVTRVIKYDSLKIENIANAELLEILQDRQKDLDKNFISLKNNAADIAPRVYEKYANIKERWNIVFEENIKKVKELERNYCYAEMKVTVPKGTYIRALVELIAEKLGVKGVTVKLIRQ